MAPADGAPPPLPPLSCDCHMHVFGPPDRFLGAPDRSYSPTEMPLAAYRKAVEPLGLSRVVLVQPSGYGTDNRCLLETLRGGGDAMRAVVALPEAAGPDDIEALHGLGVRGVRLNLMTPRIDDAGEARRRLEAAARAVGRLGWHVQIYADSALVSSIAAVLKSAPVPVVLDHMAGARADAGLAQPGFQEALELISAGPCWVKLSGADIVAGRDDDLSSAVPFARALIAANPHRLVWGTDWPHLVHRHGPFGADAPPAGYRPVSEATCLRLLWDCAGDDEARRLILADNPAALYFA